MEKKQHPVYQAIRAAFPHTIPVLTGYLVLGVAYGVLMQTKGYGTPWVLLMCCLAYCGSMQFVAITLLTTVFDPIQAFLMSLMVNARHLFYGVSMLGKFRGMGGVKPILIYTLELFDNHPDIDAIICVCLNSWIPFLEKMLKKFEINKVVKIVPGGTSGQNSIYHGLCAAGICQRNC